MTWRRSSRRATALVVSLSALVAGGFLYCASSPWLVWYSLPAELAGMPPSDRILIFSTNIPSVLAPEQAEYFTTPLSRWQYALAHSTRAAWLKTATTLVHGTVPLHPAAVLYTKEWFEVPTLLLATSDGHSLHVLTYPVSSREAVGKRGSARSSSLITDARLTPLTISLPGQSLGTLPAPLRDQWNTLLRAQLGFTATSPDIITELIHHSHVLISVTALGTAVGIREDTGAEASEWATTVEGWVVNEDRFRRPVEQAFRLPDGTLGREKIAGLPGDVWQNTEGTRTCRTPIAGKPALWSCDEGSYHLLATYYWNAEDEPDGDPTQWEITVGPEFLASLPGISGITVVGDGLRAAGVITQK